jgi:opacity protein-like surface antigen
MIVRLLRILTAGVIFVFATGAQAQGQDPKLWYVALGAGGAWYDALSVTGTTTGTLNMDTGFTLNGAIGRYLDDVRVLRLEAEALYDRNDVSNIDGTKASGNISNASLMFNFLYDIHINASWIPYLGGGIGYSRVSIDNLSSPGALLVDDSDDVFSWQFKGGIAYQFNPSMAMTVGYRYYGTDNLVFSGPAGALLKSGGTRVQSVEVGFRLHF